MGLFYFDSLESLQSRIPVFIAISFMLSVCYNFIYFFFWGVDTTTIPLTFQDYVLSFQGWLFTYLSLVIYDFLPDLECNDNKDVNAFDKRFLALKQKIDSAKKFSYYNITEEVEDELIKIRYEFEKRREHNKKIYKMVILKLRIIALSTLLIIILGSVISQYIFNYRFVFLIGICFTIAFAPYVIVAFNIKYLKHLNIAYTITTIFVFASIIVIQMTFYIQESSISTVHFNSHNSESIILRTLENGVFVYNQNDTLSFIYKDGNYINYKIDKDVLNSIHRDSSSCYIEILCKKHN